MILGSLLAQITPPPEPVGFQPPSIDWMAILPVLLLVGGAILLLVTTALDRRPPTAGFPALFTVVVAGATIISAVSLWTEVDEDGPRLVLGDAVAVDGFSLFFTVLIGVAIILTSLAADHYVTREDLPGPELHALMMLSGAGGVIMASANDLIVLFLGLEVLSIALYVMAGFHLRREESREAAVKYFVLGAFASAFLLYGIALIYGATGTTNLFEIATFLARNSLVADGLLMGGMALLLVGLGFKVAAVPFHAWTPDVYQGAPTPVTGFMAAVAKAAGFAGLLRVFASGFGLFVDDWTPIIGILAVLTLALGSVLAIVQSDVKRALAYSSISHAGYVLVGMQAGTSQGVAGSLFYLFVYAVMALGAFSVVTLVGRTGDAAHSLDDYRGLSRQRPYLAFALTVFLLAQAGVPLTSGFLAKLEVISAAVDAKSYVLAVIAMLAAAVAAFLYLRIIVPMYSRTDDGGEGDGTDAEPAPVALPFSAGLGITAALAFTLLVGFLPDRMVDFAHDATLLVGLG